MGVMADLGSAETYVKAQFVHHIQNDLQWCQRCQSHCGYLIRVHAIMDSGITASVWFRCEQCLDWHHVETL
jgi:hypothetical protein